MSKKEQPPDEIIGDFSEHLWYEVEMLNKTEEKLPDLKKAYDSQTCEPDAQTAYYAHIESFLIHARNLIQFLFECPKHGDEIVAKRILSTPDANNQKLPKKTDFLGETYKDAHRWLAHPTKYRVIGPPKEWQTRKIRRDIMKALFEFHKLVLIGLNEAIVKSPGLCPGMSI